MSRRDEYIPVASSIPTDNDSDVQTELNKASTSASPGFGFGRSGNLSAGTWLMRVGNVPSIKTGVTMGIGSPIVTRIDIGNEDINTFEISIYEHEGDGVNLTFLGTVQVLAARTGLFQVNFPATSGRQLAVKVESGSCKNPGVDVTLSGTN